VKGSAGVMAVVLAETVAGSAMLLWCTPLWNEVKRGFFVLMGVLLVVLASATLFSAAAGAIPGNTSGSWSVRLAFATADVIALATVLLRVRQPAAARVVGIGGAVLSLATLFAMAGTGRQSLALSLFQLLVGAAFLGSVLDGLMLGHWYLTDRGLSRGPINRYTDVMLGSVAIEVVAVITSGFSGTGSSQGFNPILTAGALAPWIALGMTGTTGLIAVFTRASLKGERASAVQSATGFYYLAVVTALTAELAVKTRYLAV
jgi:hypothetical protein